MSVMKAYLIGNPNCGKTSLFNTLTGSNVKIGNWPGVTVERREGFRGFKGKELQIFDLPGAYSLNPFTPEEKIVTECLDEAAKGLVVNILDAGNLERNLLLAFQLLELGIKPVLALNCFDEFTRLGGRIDLDLFRKMIGCDCYPTIAPKNVGIEELLDGMVKHGEKHDSPVPDHVKLHRRLIEACEKLLVTEGLSWEKASPLKRRDVLNAVVDSKTESQGVMAIQRELLDSLSGDGVVIDSNFNLECWLATIRYQKIARVLKACVSSVPATGKDRSDQIDAVLLNKFAGIPGFFLIMGFVFWVTFTVGAVPGEWMKAGLAWIQLGLQGVIPAGLISDLLINGVLAGVGGVLVFLPNVAILFFCMAILEDSGYLARVAFLMDRMMRLIGLHGYAFIPMILGFGCNVPAIMASRIINSRRQRLQLMFMIPLVGCSARLPVFILLTGIFFPQNPSAWLSAFFVINVALIAGIGILSGYLYKTENDSHFVLEMPPYRFPVWKNVKSQLLEKTGHFVKKAGTVILWGTILVWFLQAFPREVPLTRDYEGAMKVLKAAGDDPSKKAEIEGLQAAWEQEILAGRYMGRLGNLFLPFVKPLGFGWREAVSLVPGFLAKESIVSTLSVLYAPVSPDLGTAMKKEGMTPIGAFSFMLFTLLYVPCLATVGVIHKESGSINFTLLTIFLPAILAWGLAFTVFRAGLFLGFS